MKIIKLKSYLFCLLVTFLYMDAQALFVLECVRDIDDRTPAEVQAEAPYTNVKDKIFTVYLDDSGIMHATWVKVLNDGDRRLNGEDPITYTNYGPSMVATKADFFQRDASSDKLDLVHIRGGDTYNLKLEKNEKRQTFVGPSIAYDRIEGFVNNLGRFWTLEMVGEIAPRQLTCIYSNEPITRKMFDKLNIDSKSLNGIEVRKKL